MRNPSFEFAIQSFLNSSNLWQSGQKIFGVALTDQLHVFSTAHKITIAALNYANYISADFTLINFSFFSHLSPPRKQFKILQLNA